MEVIVASFTFSAEQIRSAPPEVRQWIENDVVATLHALAEPPHRPSPAHSAELAACTPEEALLMFEAIRGDFATTQVFLELAREAPIGRSNPPLHALNLGDMMRHTRLTDGRLLECFRAINQVFQEIRKDPEAALFGFDEANHVYIDEATHRSIRALWEELVRMREPAIAAAPGATTSPSPGFMPPHVGPSEDVATHHRS